YDIEATSGNGESTHEQLHEMLRNLMADRFKLRFHAETREVAGHAISVAKNGPKLKPSKGETRGVVKIAGAAINKFDAVDSKNTNLNTVIAEGVTISEFVKTFANLPGVGPIVDKTGLTGLYDIMFSWEPGESLARAMQEELGLRFEPENV